MNITLQKCVLETQIEIYRRQVENVEAMIKECICHPHSPARSFLRTQLELYTSQIAVVEKMLNEVIFPQGVDVDEKDEKGFAQLVHQARMNVKKANCLFDH